VLETFIPQYMDYVSDVREASLGWQGGEPTLAGLEFFKRVVILETRYAAPGTVISNDIQTNGVLLDDAWAAFFEEYNFLVGISLDGPGEIHDAHRLDRHGRGSFDRVMSGIKAVRKRNIDLNILSVVGSHNVAKAKELLRFYVSEGYTHVQFMPAMDFQAIRPAEAPSYLVSAVEYGEFLMELFDEWYLGGNPTISIRTFDTLLQSYLGLAPGLCTHSATCDSGIIVEHDGEIYPCDFYINEGFRLGNIKEQSLKTLVNSADRATFIAHKQPYPNDCTGCKWLCHCRGGCPRNRPAVDQTDCFCTSYKMLFEHANERFETLVIRLRRRAAYLEKTEAAGGRHPGRNEYCLCGSGTKYNNCCGNPAAAASYLFS
jgi:serine-type anaerobic sulfatase-maturating enzyme